MLHGVLSVALPAISLPVRSATRCPATGVFRFTFALGGLEVPADLTVCWLVEQGLAWLRFITVDRVHADRATGRLVEAWVAANEHEVFAAALEAA